MMSRQFYINWISGNPEILKIAAGNIELMFFFRSRRFGFLVFFFFCWLLCGFRRAVRYVGRHFWRVNGHTSDDPVRGNHARDIEALDYRVGKRGMLVVA